jgi:hypothetical protein
LKRIRSNVPVTKSWQPEWFRQTPECQAKPLPVKAMNPKYRLQKVEIEDQRPTQPFLAWPAPPRRVSESFLGNNSVVRHLGTQSEVGIGGDSALAGDNLSNPLDVHAVSGRHGKIIKPSSDLQLPDLPTGDGLDVHE